MSKSRNKRQDRDATRDVILQKITDNSGDGKNWLGHKLESKAATLDVMLLNGASMAEMKKVRGAVSEHIWHLENDHGLAIKCFDNIYKIDRAGLGLS